jgi:hypothetical protein
VIEQRPPLLLRLKRLLRDVHPAVWRRVKLSDSLSIADSEPRWTLIPTEAGQ